MSLNTLPVSFDKSVYAYICENALNYTLVGKSDV